MRGWGWMGLGVGLFAGAVGLAAVSNWDRPAGMPGRVEWAVSLPDGALEKSDMRAVYVPDKVQVHAPGRVSFSQVSELCSSCLGHLQETPHSSHKEGLNGAPGGI